MEIVSDSINLKIDSGLIIKYKMWKQNLHLWDQFVKNKKRKTKKVDEWCYKILHESFGLRLAYNCGGLFFKDIDNDIRVLEHYQCPINVAGIEYVNSVNPNYINSVDSLIMINPISLKYHSSLTDFFNLPGESRAGHKPNILNWLSANSKIFLSFSDYHIYYNRLKYSCEEYILRQLDEIKNLRLYPTFIKIDKSDTDLVNGNVKLILERR